MNHLRELLELCDEPSPPLRVNDAVSDQDCYAILNDVKRVAPSSMCFWMGDVSDGDGLKAVKQLSALPFDCCWFEMSTVNEHGQWLIACLVFNHPGGTRLVSFSRLKGQWCLSGVADMDEFTAGEMRVLPRLDAYVKAARGLRYKVASFITAMNCKNVTKVRNDPPQRLARARASRQKKPLFTYWTLAISGREDDERIEAGGSHASPRLHLRRGHPREYTAGKWTWVSPTVVGNKAAGVVHKDYSASPALLGANRREVA